MEHVCTVHFKPHRCDEWQLSAPMILLGLASMQGISFPASHMMDAIAKLLSILDACDCSAPFHVWDLSYNVLRIVGARNGIEERETTVRKTWNNAGYTAHFGSFDNQNTFPAI
jgi:hypothetical protein